MKDNSFLAWASFVLFLVSAVILLFLAFFSSMLSGLIENPAVIFLTLGVFSLLAMILGFLSFRAPQAKAGGIGGLVILLFVLFVTPVTRVSTVPTPELEANLQEETGRTGIPEVDTIIDTMLAGDPQQELQLLQFSSLACTRADGLGGPPKCREGEAEGTQVEAFPILGSEGHHVRQDEVREWKSIQASDVYAVYRVSENVYSDEYFPAGEYAIIFLTENEGDPVTAHVRGGKIVRLDYHLGGLAYINLDQVASEVILQPGR